MIKHGLTYGLILFTLAGFAQLADLWRHEDHQAYLQTSGGLSAVSNAIPIGRLQYALQGKPVRASDKNAVNSRLAEQNFAGFNVHYQLRFVCKDDSLQSVKHVVAWERHVEADASFNRATGLLLLDGNSQFSGQTMDLGRQALTFHSYQQMKYGRMYTIDNDHGKWLLGAVMGINIGQRVINASIDRGSFFTDSIGQSIQIDYQGHLHHNMQGNSTVGMKGTGLSAGLFVRHETGRNILSLSCQNLGFIVWNRESYKNNLNTTYTFDGILIDNVFKTNDEGLLDSTYEQFKQVFLSPSQPRSFATFTPALLEVLVKRHLGESFNLSAGAYKRLFTRQSPMFYLKAQMLLRENLDISPVVSYRSHEKFNIGMEMNILLADKWSVRLHTLYLNTLIFPEKATAVGGYATVTRIF